MKKIVFLFVITGALIACNQNDKAAENISTTSDSLNNKTADQENMPTVDSANFTTIQWLDSNYRHMGKIVDGQQLEVTFRFKNTGNKPLLISNVTAGCGCTIPETPKEPFAPGNEGVIKAVFSSQGRPGNNRKEVFVTANTNPANTVLVFEVEVLKNKLTIEN